MTDTMRRAVAALVSLLVACAISAAAANAASGASSYEEALGTWRGAADVNDWIKSRFEYDRGRALQLSETQRSQSAPPIHTPAEFFVSARGVCVDLSRFAVETLRVIAPQAKPAYLMIEFDPVSIEGNTVRRHWLVSFDHGGQRYFFADSERPGYIAGPYATTQAFIDEYARYRGRRTVAFREMQSYKRQQRASISKHQPADFERRQ